MKLSLPKWTDEQSYEIAKTCSQDFILQCIIEHFSLPLLKTSEFNVIDLPSENFYLLDWLNEKAKKINYTAREIDHDRYEKVKKIIKKNSDYKEGNILDLRGCMIDIANLDLCNAFSKNGNNNDFLFVMHNNFASKSILFINHLKSRGNDGFDINFKNHEYQETIVKILKRKGHENVRYITFDYFATSAMIISIFFIG